MVSLSGFLFESHARSTALDTLNRNFRKSSVTGSNNGKGQAPKAVGHEHEGIDPFPGLIEYDATSQSMLPDPLKTSVLSPLASEAPKTCSKQENTFVIQSRSRQQGEC